ncbi:Uncharacterised protein [Mycobacteroides abscessus subsp. abscessus]|nr:Uncharacterised protein [Mycobacteroides abscessus subsp. abscessus]
MVLLPLPRDEDPSTPCSAGSRCHADVASPIPWENPVMSCAPSSRLAPREMPRLRDTPRSPPELAIRSRGPTPPGRPPAGPRRDSPVPAGKDRIQRRRHHRAGLLDPRHRADLPPCPPAGAVRRDPAADRLLLGIIGVCQRRKAKWQGATAIVVSAAGTVAGFITLTLLIAIPIFGLHLRPPTRCHPPCALRAHTPSGR